MLHQTLIASSASSSSPFFLHANDAATAPPPAPFPCSSSQPSPRGSAMPSYAYHHSPMDGRMDAMKSSAFPPEETAEEAAAAANAALVERDGFSVEDLLDLEEFGEPDKDGADHDDAPPPPATAPEEAEVKTSPGDSQPSSIVTYELPPPPPPEMVDLPAHDVEEELEWVSRIMDDSLSEVPPPPQPLAMAVAAQAAPRPPLAHRHPNDGAYRALPPAPGPLRTTTICALSTEALVPVKAKRSKRSRSSAWSVSGASLFSDSTSSSSTATTSSCSSSSASFSSFFLLDSPPFGSPDFEGYRHFLPPQPKKSKHSKGGKHKPKKRGRKPKHAPQLTGAAAVSAAAASQAGQGDRRCSHCGVQKTPQWRAGPEGAKTLCNACGVRYKSGRLLPEYRPACSPTFVSSIHSNSHRKVLEMRRKKDAGLLEAAAPAVASF